MIIENQENVEVSQSTPDEMSFGITNLAAIFGILRKKIYSNAILAVVREISSNARDANVEAGFPDKPICVHIPSSNDPVFKVKDNGLGISPDRMQNIFINYGSSTKRDTNDQIGGFGLGAKSPFAYTDAFNLDTIHNGIKYCYAIFLDETNLGKVMLISQEPTTEPSGTTVIVPVEQGDIYSFRGNINSVFRTWRIKPECNAPYEIENVDGNIIYENEYGYIVRSKLLGFSTYYSAAAVSLADIQYSLGDFRTDIYYIPREMAVVLKFKTGELELASNRESITYSKEAQEKISGRLTSFHEEMSNFFTSKVNELPLEEVKEFINNYARQLYKHTNSIGIVNDFVNKDLYARTDVSFKFFKAIINGLDNYFSVRRAYIQTRNSKNYKKIICCDMSSLKNKDTLGFYIEDENDFQNFQYKPWLTKNPGKQAVIFHITKDRMDRIDADFNDELVKYIKVFNVDTLDRKYFQLPKAREKAVKVIYSVFSSTHFVKSSKKDFDEDTRVKVFSSATSGYLKISDITCPFTGNKKDIEVYMGSNLFSEIMKTHTDTHVCYHSNEDLSEECDFTIEEFIKSGIEKLDISEALKKLKKKRSYEITKNGINSVLQEISDCPAKDSLQAMIDVLDEIQSVDDRRILALANIFDVSMSNQYGSSDKDASKEFYDKYPMTRYISRNGLLTSYYTLNKKEVRDTCDYLYLIDGVKIESN
jgi:hypothetical protein